MDITLPGENALELTRKIEADYPSVIIITLTSHFPCTGSPLLDTLVSYFLSKGSITTDEIFKLVKSIILGKGFNADGSDN